MRYFKKIAGERIYLSPIVNGDAAKFAEWLSDIEITKYLSLAGKIMTVDEEYNALQVLAADNLAIVANDGDVLLGICGFIDINLTQRYAEIGIFIGEKNYLGRGFGTEALRLLMEFGFNVRNLHSIRLRVRSFNERAIRCYEKCGFKTVGRYREAGRINGEYFDEILMDIVEEEYRALRGS